jgi:phosphoglycerol transferase
MQFLKCVNIKLTKVKSTVSSTNEHLLVALFIFSFLANQIYFNIGLLPSVVDELVYRNNILFPKYGSNVPDYVYRIIYGYAFNCKIIWLECGRVFNVFFYSLGSLFCYLVARKHLTLFPSLITLVVCFLSPMKGYTAYFMPESIYFSFFWLTIYCIFLYEDRTHIKSISIVMFPLAMLGMIKPHALILLCIYLMFIAGELYLLKNFSYRSLIINTSYVLFFYFGLRFVVGYVFFSSSDSSLLGGTYEKILVNNLNHNDVNYVELITLFARSLIAHTGVLVLLMSASFLLLTNLSDLKKYESRNGILLFTRMLFLGYIICISAFTVVVAFTDSSQFNRVHLRYYNFIYPMLPLFILIAANRVNVNEILSASRRHLYLIVLILFLLFIGFTKFAPFIPDYVDGPELRGIVKYTKFFNVYVLLSLAGIIYALTRKKMPIRFIAYVQIPIFFLIAWTGVKGDISNRFNQSSFDAAPKIINSIIPKSEHSKMSFIADPSALGIQTLSKIYYDEPNIGIVSKKTGSHIDTESSSILHKWIILFGEYNYDKRLLYKKYQGFSILKLNDDRFIDFRLSGQGDAAPYTAIGLGSYEPWGAWSNEDVVRLNFDEKLPQRLQVVLNAFSYPDNANDEFQICYVNICKLFNLNESARVLLFDFEADDSGNSIEFKIKNPVDIGGRRVGLGFIEMEIKDLRGKN